MQNNPHDLHHINEEKTVFSWVKDINFKIIGCSDNFAEVAATDSPKMVIGKDDYDLIWKKNADLFRGNDVKVIKAGKPYINIIEKVTVAKNGILILQPWLVTKLPIFDKNGTCIGISGSGVEIKQQYNCVLPTHHNKKEKFWLPPPFEGVYLTSKELSVLKLVMLGKTSKLIARELSISHRTVEEHIYNIRQKLKCQYKHEIQTTIIEYGLLYGTWRDY